MVAASPTESTPLLAAPPSQTPAILANQDLISPFRKLLLTCLLLSVAFIYTATPLIYAFRTITCDNLYDDGTLPPYDGDGDRCAIHEVESQTAASISLMVTFTTFSGVLNLLTTGWYMRKWGVRMALVMQTLVPIFRNVCQIFAIRTGGEIAIPVLQWTQLLTIFGGGAGLTANSYVAVLVAPEERTASFGIIQGIAMAGTAIGYTVGGLTGDLYGAPAPFEVTLVLLILSTILSGVFLPYIAPAPPVPTVVKDGAKAEKGDGVWSFLSPLKVFLPRVIEKEDGGDGLRYWGLTLLGTGVFVGVLALAYVPLMLQLTATNTYDFKPTQNGYMLSTNATVRAIFLMFAFPKIIARGRLWYTARSAPSLPPQAQTPPLGTHAEDFEPPSVTGEATEPVLPPKPTDQAHGSRFDLLFVRCSMVLDGILTGCMVFANQGWHMYLAASLIPFASGTAPAAKGVIMDMVPAAQQPDALAAISLIEMLATVITVSIFGILFAALSEVGLARWTFVCNAGLALFAAAILCFVRFPPSKRPAFA